MQKHLHRYCVALLSMLGFTAAANVTVTIDDLCDPQLIAVDRLHWCIFENTDYNDLGYDQEGPLGLSNEVTFERVYESNQGIYSDNEVVIRGFKFGTDTRLQAYSGLGTRTLAFKFMLSHDGKTPTTDGTGEKLIIATDHYMSGSGTGYYSNYDVDYGRYAISCGYVWDMGAAYGEDPELVYNFNYNNLSKSGPWVGEINRDETGNIQINFNSPVIVTDTKADPIKYQNAIFGGYYAYAYLNLIIDRFHIDMMKPNAVLSGKLAERNHVNWTTGSFATPVDHEDYRCLVNMTGRNTFEVINLTQNGYGIGMGNPDGIHSTHQRIVTGGYNLATGEAWLDGGQEVYVAPQINSSGYMTHIPFDMKMANIYRNASPSYDFDDIVGTVSEGTELAHKLKDTHWVSNGGTLRTYEAGITMTFPDFGYVHAEDYFLGTTHIQRFEYSPCYTDNTLSVAPDVTLELDHNLDLFGINEEDGTTMFVKTTVTPLRNTQYVDHYELWMMPHPGSTFDVKTADFGHDDGHTKGYYLTSYTPKAVSRAGDDLHAPFEFQKVFDLSTLPAANTHRKNQYAFYVKAVYKPETNLHPSFHNLVMDADEVITAIDAVDSGAQAIIVKGEVGAIVVETSGATPANIEVYTPAGAQVYSGTDTRIELPAGLYIVRTNRLTHKVVVR